MAKSITKILVVHEPGRKRANLVVLLGSIVPAKRILVVDTPEDSLDLLCDNPPVLVLMGVYLSRLEMDRYLREISRRNSQSRVLLMLPHPLDCDPYPENHVDGILYDGFSPCILKEMLGRFA